MSWWVISTRMAFSIWLYPSDGGSYVAILQGNGDGTFKPFTTAYTGASQVGSVAIGDFNGDGYPDLATTSAPDNSIYILLNKATATPSFQAPVPYVQNDGTPAPCPYYLTHWRFQSRRQTGHHLGQ